MCRAFLFCVRMSETSKLNYIVYLIWTPRILCINLLVARLSDAGKRCLPLFNEAALLEVTADHTVIE
jgi:hypothetical protein